MEEQKQSTRATSSRKKLLRMVAVIIIAIIVVAFLIYYWQTRINLVRITEFSVSNGGTTQDQVIYHFDLKVANQGINDVNNLTFIVQVLGNGSELGRESNYLPTLRSGQEEDWSYGIVVDMNVTVGQVINYLASVESNGNLLDKAVTS